MKVKVRLDTLTDVRDFVGAASQSVVPVYLTDGNNLRISAQSLIGVMYTMEWNEVFCTCENDVYHLIERFVVID